MNLMMIGWIINENIPRRVKDKEKSQTNSKESTPNTENKPIINNIEKCSVCGTTFESRNQLFNHVKSEGHAAPPPKSKSKSKRKINANK